MGQSASRNRPLPSSSSAAPDPDSTPAQSTGRSPTSSQGTISAGSKRSRRSSIRRSLLGLIPQTDSAGSVRSSPSSSAHSTQPAKKRWRYSRRWSKAPVAEHEVMQDDNVPEAEDNPTVDEGADEHDTRPRTPVFDAPPAASSSAGPNPERLSDEQPLSEDDWPKGSGSPPEGDEHPINQQSYEPPSAAELHQDIAEFLGSEAVQADEPAASELPTEPPYPPAPEPEAAQQAPRQFPPPGTLVVVQGVVNTTDASPPSHAPPSTIRPSRSITPRPASGMQGPSSLRRSASASGSAYTAREDERRGARNRLSSFISRSRPSSDIRPTELTSNRNSAVSSEASSSLSHDTVSAEEPSSEENQDPSRTEDEGRPRALSPGSIDVLGTLLSVAAAATAASLFSPGLAGGGSNGLGNTPAGPNRPMSPTPTAGLGNLAGLNNLAGLGFDPMGMAPGHTQGATLGQRDGRDRIRNVWESVRDRLGLHSRSPVLSGLNPSQSEGGGDGGEVRMRPGEVMLAEMARALNIGLGLNSDGHPTNARQTDQAASEGESPSVDSAADGAPLPESLDGADHLEPSEDSFERFLINLQADLRIALSEDGMRVQQNQRDGLNSLTSTDQHDSGPVAGPSDNHSRSETALFPEHGIPFSSHQDDELGDDEPPPLADSSDSESDFDEDDGDVQEDAAGVPHSARTPTPIPSGAFPFSGDNRHTADGDRRPPGVNLWRLYRFPPIPAIQTQGHAASTSSDGPSASAADTAPSLMSESASSAAAAHPLSSTTTSQESSADSSGSTSMPSASTVDANANVVVPVIVVGLQSVEMGRAHDHHHGTPEYMQHMDDTRPYDGPNGSTEDSRHISVPSMDGPSFSPPRGRTWQSRAANALRTLRPGRRGGSHGAPTADATGARTFLIYVIGGYYPPNHHMVTGSDSLDSYEALWELAELLGQVKPPVATREDIDNSGLQIIKSTDLHQCELDGRVASNCTERCLICLDDYQMEDDIRLMTCKHAFHKECVDKWLQVGRNNCPACRSKGVSTAGDASS